MFPLALHRKNGEQREYHKSLRTHHSLHVRVYVLNLDHDHLADLSNRLDDGQVNIDAASSPTRTATLSFLDKERGMDFDSDSPGDGALFANRMLRIEYRVKVDALGDWVSVPIFTGPIVSMDRAGDYVNVECQGKEVLAMGAAWEPMQVKKGVSKVDAIRRIMRERGGESRFSFPDLKTRLPKTVSLGRESVPWEVCQRIADSIGEGRQLFYDGSGRLRLRKHPENDVFTFADGEGGTIMSEPQVNFATDNLSNKVWIKGGKPKAQRRDNETRAEFEDRQDKERGVRGEATAPHRDPLSPFWPRGLGRPDAPRFLLETVENDHTRSEKDAERQADRILRKRLKESVDVTFDALVVPHLEESDLVRIDTRTFSTAFHVDQMSIPLKHDGLMSVGYTRRVSVQRRRPNKRRDHKHKARGKKHHGGKKAKP